jgi:hypothetical protein
VLHFGGMRRLLWVATFLLISAVFMAGQSNPALAVRLRSAKNLYNIRHKIELEIVRDNIGHEPIALSSLWFWGVMRTDVYVLDKAGLGFRLAREVPLSRSIPRTIEFAPGK